MLENPLIYTQLSLRVACCGKCKYILKFCEIFLKTPAGKKSPNQISPKQVPASFVEHLRKQLTKL